MAAWEFIFFFRPSWAVNKAGSQGSELPGFVLEENLCVLAFGGLLICKMESELIQVGVSKLRSCFLWAPRHENIPAIALVSQLLPRSLISVLLLFLFPSVTTGCSAASLPSFHAQTLILPFPKAAISSACQSFFCLWFKLCICLHPCLLTALITEGWRAFSWHSSALSLLNWVPLPLMSGFNEVNN